MYVTDPGGWTNAELLETGLEQINEARANHDHGPIEQLEPGCRGLGFHDCLLGVNIGDASWASHYAEVDPVLRELEARFEGGLLPRALYTHDPKRVERTGLRYLLAHAG